MNELEKRIFNLRKQEEKALNAGDVVGLLNLKEQRLKLELEEVQSIRGATSEDKPKLFKPQLLDDIEAIKMEIVGKNFIPLVKPAYNVISGRGGSGKSLVALKSMLLWLRDNPSKTAIAYFTEDAKDEIEKRTRAICSINGLNLDLLERIFFITLDNDDRKKWVHKVRDEYVIEEIYIKEIIDFAKENQSEFILLDPLKRFHRLNENSNDDMDVVVRDCFARIAVDTNSVFLVLHHSSKGENGSRGAGTITDSARIAYTVGRYFVQGKDGKLVENPKKKGKIQLEFIKDNLGLEKQCQIRDTEDNAIFNPMYGVDKVFEEIEFVNETEYEVEMPDIF